MLTNVWNCRGKGHHQEVGSLEREEPQRLGGKKEMGEGQQPGARVTVSYKTSFEHW